MRQTHQIGAHTIVAEGDVVLCLYRGATSIPELEATHRIIEAALATHRDVYQIIDFSTLPMPTTQVRKWLANWARTHRLRAVVGFGAAPPMRILLNLLANAVKLIRGDAPPTVVFKTEAETRAWIETDRQREAG